MELSDLQRMADAAKPSEKMPVLFLGHGSPMYAIQENEFTREWARLGRDLPRPRAVLCVSAHWLTRGTAVTAVEMPTTIHDFGGFPPELFAVRYPAPGDPEAAREVAEALRDIPAGLDLEWGLDHGTWSVLRHMYPGADIPVLQLSIDYHKPGAWHYDLGRRLAALRRKGFLIVGSGNMVHNLRRVDFSKADEPEYGYDWAHAMNAVFKKHILDGDHAPLLAYEKLGPEALLAIPTPDHYYPLLYILGLQEEGEA